MEHLKTSGNTLINFADISLDPVGKGILKKYKNFCINFMLTIKMLEKRKSCFPSLALN